MRVRSIWPFVFARIILRTFGVQSQQSQKSSTTVRSLSDGQHTSLAYCFVFYLNVRTTYNSRDGLDGFPTVEVCVKIPRTRQPHPNPPTIHYILASRVAWVFNYLRRHHTIPLFSRALKRCSQQPARTKEWWRNDMMKMLIIRQQRCIHEQIRCLLRLDHAGWVKQWITENNNSPKNNTQQLN